MKKLNIENVRKALLKLSDHLKVMGNELPVEKDFYKLISTRDWQASYPEHYDSSVYSLFDDIDEIDKLAQNQKPIVTYVDYDRIASILRYISEYKNPPSPEPKILISKEAYQMLLTPELKILDRFLLSQHFYYEAYTPRVQLAFGEHCDSETLFLIELIDIIEMYQSFEKYKPGYVERYKLLILNNGNYYLSLDPCNEDNVVSENDGDVIIAKKLMLKY